MPPVCKPSLRLPAKAPLSNSAQSFPLGARIAALLGLTLVAPLVALGAAELTLRVIDRTDRDAPWQTRGFHRPDPELIYAMAPNAENTMVDDEFVEYSRTNSLGLRDDEVGDKLGERIIVLGDSLTFGQGVAAKESYPDQLEALFAQEGRAVDVINAGVKGYGTDQSFRLFSSRLRSLDPDVLVLAFSPTDLFDNFNLSLYRLDGDVLVALDAKRHPLYREGRLLRALPRFLREWRLVRLSAPLLARIGAFNPHEEPGADDIAGWTRRKTRIEIGELVGMGREDDFAVLVLGIPGRAQGPDQYRWLHDDKPEGVRFLDLSRDRELMRFAERYYFAEDIHLNRAGHRLVAERLRAKIERSGILQER